MKTRLQIARLYAQSVSAYKDTMV